MQDYNRFVQSLEALSPPRGLTSYLEALWWDAKGKWEKAHELVQHDPSLSAAWIHAYLHRKEGDAGNAAYWYQRAQRPYPGKSLEEEWQEMLNSFLKENGG